MSLLNTLAKLYVRHVFRDDGAFHPLKTQRELNVPDPPRGIARRTELIAGSVRAFWIDKPNRERGVLVYLHGGAFYFGPVKEHWLYLTRICGRSGLAGVLVDYKFAPQSPFPVGLNEIVESVAGLDLPANWFFAGDSSGAGMAVSATFKLRDANRSLPKGLVLMSPWVDLLLRNPGIEDNKHEDVMMTVERLSSAARIYAGDHDPSDPLISPMFGDLAGLPAMLIQIGTADLLLADARKFRDKCIDAGVEVQYEEYLDCFHSFMMAGFLPEAKSAMESQVEFLSNDRQNH